MVVKTVETALRELIKTQFDTVIDPVVTRPDASFGDFATNVAMQLAPKVGKNPREIAQVIVDGLKARPHIAAAEVAGPGFINIVLADDALVAGARLPFLTMYQGQSVVIETNNPNPFKDLHIGHAYNCIVADTVANLLEAGDADVHRVSYHGDVGLHVGKSMWAILQYIANDINKLDQVAEGDRPKFMSDRYIEGAKAYEDDPAAKEEIEQLARESFAPEGLYKDVYDKCKAWSFDYITDTVERLGSQAVEKRYLESDADKVGVATVREHVGDVFTESDGAIVFEGEQYGLHTRVFIASRGTGLYEARDLGLMQLKDRDFQAGKSIIVTAEEQREYFKVVFKAAELALPDLSGVTQNISTGTVKLSSGKMSSRTGAVLNIEWLFESLRGAMSKRGGDETDQDTIIGALRYSMLRPRIGGDVIFDVEQSLSLEGNSGPYLQYAHARARSIIRKSTVGVSEPAEFTPDERTLAAKLSEYSEVLETAVRGLLPHHICTYLYELSQEFNRFYERSQVIGDPREAERLWLVECYAETLRHGLSDILNIPAPERM